MSYFIKPSSRAGKKWMVTTPTGKTIHFGADGYSDYTIHKDSSRKNNYLARHAARENWTKSGIETAGFWSRWILWNLPSLISSMQDTADRFNIIIEYTL